MSSSSAPSTSAPKPSTTPTILFLEKRRGHRTRVHYVSPPTGTGTDRPSVIVRMPISTPGSSKVRYEDIDVGLYTAIGSSSLSGEQTRLEHGLRIGTGGVSGSEGVGDKAKVKARRRARVRVIDTSRLGSTVTRSESK